MEIERKSQTDPANALHFVLSAKYSGLTLGELRLQARQIEDDIRDVAQAEVINHFSQFASFRQLAAPREFFFRNKLYSVHVAGAVRNPMRLEVCILDVREPTGPTHAWGPKAFDGAGYFRDFDLQVPHALQGYAETVAEIVFQVYVAAYAWLEAELFKLVKAVEQGFADALYQYLRTVLNAEERGGLADRVWFSIFSEKSGYYALDGKAIEAILDVLKQRRYVSDLSPLSHVVSLIGLQMPSAKSLSMDAITSRRYTEYSLQKAAYVSDMSDIFKTEEQMTLGGAYAIFPLGAVGDQQLVAAFPSSLRDDLRPVFEKNREVFQLVYQQEVRSLKRHIARIQASFRRADRAEYAGMAGRFLSEVLKPWLS
ncbi:MAG: hypothetical protein EPO12_12765 [Aquabacterium sp.]|jgi:hypothetical protein|nr:MAG: hypothetical protein EPO12_12765 [Aquabacterium sp.]